MQTSKWCDSCFERSRALLVNCNLIDSSLKLFRRWHEILLCCLTRRYLKSIPARNPLSRWTRSPWKCNEFRPRFNVYLMRGCKTPRQGFTETIVNYDESVVVYGSGFVCHRRRLPAFVVHAQMMMTVIKLLWRGRHVVPSYPLIALILLLAALLLPNSNWMGNWW